MVTPSRPRGPSSGIAPLPHAYPFRFVETVREATGPSSGRVRAAVTANGRSTERGGLTPLAMAEMIAQAALLLTGEDPGIGRTGFLAGISDFVVERVPEAGDSLTVEVLLAGHLGPVVKFDGVIRDDADRPVARGSLTVRRGGA